jgi:hypothetical protein
VETVFVIVVSGVVEDTVAVIKVVVTLALLVVMSVGNTRPVGVVKVVGNPVDMVSKLTSTQ